jgi:phosphopantetheine adenylyltransferase
MRTIDRIGALAIQADKVLDADRRATAKPTHTRLEILLDELEVIRDELRVIYRIEAHAGDADNE